MTQLRYAPEVALDIQRIVSHLLAHDVGDTDGRIDEIFHALALLERHPLIGRPAAGDRRDLVIGRDARGCVARYRYEEIEGTIVVLALRAQREAGFVDR